MRMVIRTTPLVLLLGGCLIELLPHPGEPRETRNSDLEAGPSDIGVHSAILNDVRRQHLLERCPEDGRPIGSAVKLAGTKARCAVDESEMTVFTLREDQLDQPHREKETAYLCPKEGLYYYRYEGGLRRLDVWLGPYRIDLRGR